MYNGSLYRESKYLDYVPDYLFSFLCCFCILLVWTILPGRLNFDIQFVKINIRRCISIYILVPGTRATQCAGYYSRLQR